MTAYNYNQFTTPPGTEQDTWHGPNAYSNFFPTFNIGPISFCTRYLASGSVAFLFIQTDRVLVSSGALSTTTNYTINGISSPTVTGVTFTTGKSFIRLTLSSSLPVGNQYSLTVNNNTFGDGNVFNIATLIPIFVDASMLDSGIAQAVTLGSPVMSHT